MPATVYGRTAIPLFCLIGLTCGAAPQTNIVYVEAGLTPPGVAREFRGAWVATVGNIDWPSKPGLPAAQQQTELIAILDRLAQLRMNAVLLQVRPTADALYESRLEPWSWYLTGAMGEPPNPPYDPLAFALRECRRRGLELHAWFNPFRARHPSCKGQPSAGHITRLRPDLVRSHGSAEWLDPGEPEVQAHSLAVILDVARRHDLDGIHLDDYFYPYPYKTRDGRTQSFADDKTWERYQRLGGQLDRANWRRENVNRFIQRLSVSLKELKPALKFGISPFGIWRPGFPAGVKGMDAYDTLYADALTWWQLGWVDYLAPQLYWNIAAEGQSFPVLLNWWAAQNKPGHHLWPGIALAGTDGKRHPHEVLRQISAARSQSGASGQILYSMNSLLTNRLNVAHLLQQHAYLTPALPPPCPWMKVPEPARPRLQFGVRWEDQVAVFRWQCDTNDVIRHWIWQELNNGQWTTRLLPGGQSSHVVYGRIAHDLPEYLALTPVNAAGVAGPPLTAKKIIELRNFIPVPGPPPPAPTAPAQAPGPP